MLFHRFKNQSVHSVINESLFNVFICVPYSNVFCARVSCPITDGRETHYSFSHKTVFYFMCWFQNLFSPEYKCWLRPFLRVVTNTRTYLECGIYLYTARNELYFIKSRKNDRKGNAWTWLIIHKTVKNLLMERCEREKKSAHMMSMWHWLENKIKIN